jgi:nucleoside phosphorylase
MADPSTVPASVLADVQPVEHGDPTDHELARHIATFDPRDPAAYRFAATPGSTQAQVLAAQVQAAPIPWPAGLAPARVKLDPAPADTDPLPRADVLIVTYTVAEGHAAADVLTPGVTTNSWTSYRHGWTTLKKSVAKGAPSLESDRAGVWALTRIGTSTAAVVKSDLHPSTDGTKLPIRDLWTQMIAEVRPKLVITTGTAGAVGAQVALGDVVVSQTVRWDATTTFADSPFAHSTYTSDGSIDLSLLAEAQKTLIPVNAAKLPAGDGTPAILTGSAASPIVVLTTDFFAFDDAADHYGLRAYQPDARAVEMDDAALGLACSGLTTAPTWVSVRNASDPQMNGADIKAEKNQAAAIYEKYGYTTTIGSAITVWALIAGAQGSGQ